VCVILARSFHPRVSLLVVATFAAYAAWTVVLTRVAAAIRRQVKNLDNEITGGWLAGWLLEAALQWGSRGC
jgi:ABC-type transport system involved in Fe-S cluster assembly fused permease/ATPase subunit